MNWIEIITQVLVFIAGGGLVTIFTMKQSKEAKQIENASALVREYRDLLDKYKAEVESQRQKIEELTAKYSELQSELASVNQRVSVYQARVHASEVLKCDRLGCMQRRPPLNKEDLDQFLEGKEG